MPVILADRDVQRAWLDSSLGADEALALCEPLAASRLTVGRPTRREQAGPRAEGPRCWSRPPEEG